MKVLVLLAKGFETMEFSVFIDVMGWARIDYHCDISVETCGFQKEVLSTFGVPVIADRMSTYHLGNGVRQKQLEKFGVTVINEPVVIDNNIITSYCPQTAPQVAFTLLEMLSNKELTEKVKTAMGFYL